MGHKQKPFWSRNTFCQIQSLGPVSGFHAQRHYMQGEEHNIVPQKDTHFDTLCMYCLLKGIMPSNHSQAWKTPAVALWKSKIASGLLYISREYHSESEEGLSCLPRLIAVQSWWLLSPVFWARAREPAAIWSPPSGAPSAPRRGRFRKQRTPTGRRLVSGRRAVFGTAWHIRKATETPRVFWKLGCPLKVDLTCRTLDFRDGNGDKTLSCTDSDPTGFCPKVSEIDRFFDHLVMASRVPIP